MVLIHSTLCGSIRSNHCFVRQGERRRNGGRVSTGEILFVHLEFGSICNFPQFILSTHIRLTMCY